MLENKKEVGADQLRRVCDPAVFHFNSTADLPPLTEIIGQERAVRATAFGVDMESPGYHIFAFGPAGTGKTTMIRDLLEQKRMGQPVPDDWCYINNFEDSDQPRLLRLPAGMGFRLQNDMNQFVDSLSSEIPSAFQTRDYERERERIDSEFQNKRQALLDELEKATTSKDFTLLQTPGGVALAPTMNGDVITKDQYNKLNEQESEDIEKRQNELQGELRETVRRIQDIQEEYRQKINQLDQDVVGYAAEHLLNRVMKHYADLESVVSFLQEVQADILKNVDVLKQTKEMEGSQQPIPFLLMQAGEKSHLEQYRVNLLVDNRQMQGAPVIFESNPTYPNLIGRIEHQPRLGALVTNFQMIKPGALHRANGGYLVVEARDILTKPMAWDGLKRALRDREVRIESMYESIGAVMTRSLDPEPVPLNLKVILIGDPMIYYLLFNLDEDLRELFKVKADFAIQMDWTEEALQQYARFVGTVCRQENLSPFAPSGVATVIEESARMVNHQHKLATKFRDIGDLIRQSSYWARKNGHEYVQHRDVRQAVEEQIYRSNQLEEHLREMIEEGTILIDTEGETVGQVNGISVLPLGDYSFGKPTRITARTGVGRGGVINIDREAKLGGRIHNKGVMILTGYLNGRFAQEIPLTFYTSITFEQLYEEVEGDSASSAELYALLSSLSGHPIRQDLAVTGSVNQLGQIQAIGGVNEKVEGFFDVCNLKNLTGRQGVIIPQSNVKHLMLREDIVETVRYGKFHIYPVSTIDEGIELLTGIRAGERNAKGEYPENTINYAVQVRLKELSKKVQAFSHNGKDKAEMVESLESD